MRPFKLFLNFIFSFSLIIFSIDSNAAGTELPSDGQKGSLAVGLAGGIGEYSFLNQDGTNAGYRANYFLLDIDFQLFSSGSGQVRMFASYLMGNGTHKSTSADELKSSEYVIGLKFYANKNIYMLAGVGQGKTELSSPSSNTINLNYRITKVGGGLEFQLTNSVFLGLEIAYQSGPLKATENTSLTQNSFYQNNQALVKLTWVPNTLSELFSSSSKY